MNAIVKRSLLATVILCCYSIAVAQLPVELFAGHKRASIDIMFFRFFKNRHAQQTPWLFFNRNRATVDYTITPTTNLPQFGFTEAISFNHKKLKGIAPVAVAAVLNRGIYPKAGIQFTRSGKNTTLFTWLVCDVLQHPNIDWFFLGRYTPGISKKLHLFAQAELVNAFPTYDKNNYNFIQRIRLGLKIKEYQLGLGADFTATGRGHFNTTQNMGVFLRHEF
ncbi:MAG: hypothetical protein JNM68_12600 [Dinghuibacter sp.]|nr:hypothetical protein [Dinghuibacter sp.]